MREKAGPRTCTCTRLCACAYYNSTRARGGLRLHTYNRPITVRARDRVMSSCLWAWVVWADEPARGAPSSTGQRRRARAGRTWTRVKLRRHKSREAILKRIQVTAHPVKRSEQVELLHWNTGSGIIRSPCGTVQRRNCPTALALAMEQRGVGSCMPCVRNPADAGWQWPGAVLRNHAAWGLERGRASCVPGLPHVMLIELRQGPLFRTRIK